MLKTYITIAYRNFVRNKVFSLINVLGLSIGISSALVIFLIVQYDFSFDKFEKDGNRIYRVVTNMSFSGNPLKLSGVCSPLPARVKKEIPGLSEIVGFHQFNGNGKVTVLKKNNDKPFQINHQTNIVFADETYFKMIPYQWLAGSEKTSLLQPNKVVLTESRARIYFPDIPLSSVIGKQIVYDDSIATVVTGIVKDQIQNTDFIFKEFISQVTIPLSGLKEVYGWTDWTSVNGGSQLFLKLGVGNSVKKVETGLNEILKNYDQGVNTKNNTAEYRLQPFADLHFNSEYNNFLEHTAHKPTLYGLLTIAAFLLILGCINFINLTTAMASRRAKEIGVRKTLGSSATQLILQFLSETFFITIIAMLVSITITPFLLKIFADFIPKDLHYELFAQPYLLTFLFLLTLLITVFAGFYPAIILSRFKPISVLKNQVHSGASATRQAWLRKGLTVSQFLIAQIFCMATFVTIKQISFLLNKDMGFKKDAIISVYTPFVWGQQVKPGDKKYVLLNAVKKIPGVEMASLGGDAPSARGWNSLALQFKDGKKEIETDVRQKYGDTNYLKLYHIKLLAGRNIAPSDTIREFIVNETYMHLLGFQNPRDILNKQINNLPIVGVMADFNQESLHALVKPLTFSSNNISSFYLHIALKHPANSESWKTSIANVEKVFRQLYPDEDFEYDFVDSKIAKFYKSEQDISRLLTWSTGLAIFISCMGLLGLVMYTTNMRTKEIGIRKVLGASIGQIVSILSKDFIRLVLIASLIAMPLSWWAMNKWLENFAYKTPVTGWVFLLSTLFMMGIALITLSIQTIRAASANPVESLRSE
jgi:putative ABC transport system permease protein